MNLNKISGILKYSQKDINLKICLLGGQSFRWNESSVNNELIGVIEDKIVILNQNNSPFINYTAFFKSINNHQNEDIERLIIDYLRLDVDILSLYYQWSKIDPIFKQKIEHHPQLNGVRMLNQDPIENLFSFICSSNNNIKRIRKMIKALTENFGNSIGSINGEEYFTFPTIERLAQNGVENKLRELKFGYRAKFIHQAAVYLKSQFKNSNEIYELRKRSYNEVFKELVKVPGIGNKVADCICLMSFHKFQAVPIDTHVLSIASKTYNFSEVKQNGKNKTITNRNYLEIGKREIKFK